MASVLQPHKPCAGLSRDVVQDTIRVLCLCVCRLRIRLLASVLQPQVYTERFAACLSSTSDPCACRTWPELATPLLRRRIVATSGRSHLCFRGAQRVLTSVRRTWLGASELQSNKYNPHTPHACVSSLSQLGALPACVKPTRLARSTVLSDPQVAWGLGTQ